MVSRFIMRRVACSRRHFIRTVGDDCPYSKKTSVYQLTYPKSVKGRDAAKFLTNFKRCGAWDTVARVPVPFCFFFLRLKKEVTHLFFACVMRFPIRSGRNAYYIFEHAAEIIHVVIAHHSRNFAYRNVAFRKQFRGSLHS